MQKIMRMVNMLVRFNFFKPISRAAVVYFYAYIVNLIEHQSNRRSFCPFFFSTLKVRKKYISPERPISNIFSCHLSPTCETHCAFVLYYTFTVIIINYCGIWIKCHSYIIRERERERFHRIKFADNQNHLVTFKRIWLERGGWASIIL